MDYGISPAYITLGTLFCPLSIDLSRHENGYEIMNRYLTDSTNPGSPTVTLFPFEDCNVILQSQK